MSANQAPDEERPAPKRRMAPVLPDPMTPVIPAGQASAQPAAPVSAVTVAPAIAPPAQDTPVADTPVGPYEVEAWSGFTEALGGRIAAEAKALLRPLARTYGLKTERAVLEHLIVEAARIKMPDGPPSTER